MASPDLQHHLRHTREIRQQRAHDIWSALQQQGVVTAEPTWPQVVTRYHIAGAVAKAGIITDFREIFQRYLGGSQLEHYKLIAFPSAAETQRVVAAAGGVFC